MSNYRSVVGAEDHSLPSALFRLVSALDASTNGEPVDLPTLVGATGLSTSRLMRAMARLEQIGALESISGTDHHPRYRLVNPESVTAHHSNGH